MNYPERYLITAALPYANGPLHIGHIAGAYLPADIYVRFLRLKRKDVKFICGSDEHGVPITIRAKKEGITPQQVVDKYHNIIKTSFEKFGILFDNYSRTSHQIHHKTAQEFFKTLFDKKVFTEEFTEQYFDISANQFLADRYIVGECPKCSNPNAFGDQCEKCGTSLSPEELIHPKSTLSGEKPVKKKTKNWFLPLDKMQPGIEQFIRSHENDWKTNVMGQCLSWLKEGLKPRAMTRDLDWGVKLPDGLEGSEGKVLYVWFDAPIGYISATKEILEKNWEKYWKDKNSKIVHFIGKDNIVFHCIIFPAMLMAHGEFNVPDNVPANEFLNLEGEKISTSRNWAVWLHEYLEDFPEKEDELRYVLCSIAPETKDSEFTWKDFQARVNNELVAILGNYVNRVMVLCWKYFEGRVPENNSTESFSATFGELNTHIRNIENLIYKFHFREALGEFLNIVRMGNKHLTVAEPWKNSNIQEVGKVLNMHVQLIAKIGVICAPFLPFSSKKIFEMLNLNHGELTWDPASTQDLISAGSQLNKPKILFPKIEDADMEKQITKLHLSKKSNEKNPSQEVPVLNASGPEQALISFADFSKLEIRIGKIISAQKVEKADKLLKLEVDIGSEKRTVVSGIAAFYKPEEVVGQLVSILVNLAPRKIMGIQSQGMILMAENDKNELAFLAPAKNFEAGGKIS